MLSDRLLALGIDDEESVAGVDIPDGAAEDNKPFLSKRVHESRVLVPAVLVTTRAGRIPSRTPRLRHEEVVCQRHLRSREEPSV